eukprot:CAMPEP_0194238994 /NCGR_PEP_ID=MMETSP0158-20130606/5594_1 /TAXON_ID=33649 /ORGANISM="Thalassionema nitzschioides, Strain L26-B" /LENGTH=465 /DNA_ID=CAMNT_0038973381 /DNA_START=97 /DNA_END=1494 /DNA_ORIENTATION=+
MNLNSAVKMNIRSNIMSNENSSDNARFQKIPVPQSYRRPMKEYGACIKPEMEQRRGVRNHQSCVMEDDDTHHTKNLKKSSSMPVSPVPPTHGSMPRPSSGEFGNSRRTKGTKSLFPYNERENDRGMPDHQSCVHLNEDYDTEHTRNVKKTLSMPVTPVPPTHSSMPRPLSGEFGNSRRTKGAKSLSPYNEREDNRDMSKSKRNEKFGTLSAGEEIIDRLERSLDEYASVYPPTQVRDLLKRLQKSLDNASSKNVKQNISKLIPIKKSFKQGPISSASNQCSNVLESCADEAMPNHFKPIAMKINSKGPVPATEKRMDNSTSPKPMKPIPSRRSRGKLGVQNLDDLEGNVDEVVSKNFKPGPPRMTQNRTPSPTRGRRWMASNPLRKSRSRSPMVLGKNSDSGKRQPELNNRSTTATPRSGSFQSNSGSPSEVKGEGADSTGRVNNDLFDHKQRAYIDNLFGMANK